jgi:hypothetical protein
MSLLLVGAAAGGQGPNRTQPRRESGRERGGDKPYESRKRRGRGGREWRVERGGDGDAGFRFRYGGGAEKGLDSIRFDGVSTLPFLFTLSLSLSV